MLTTPEAHELTGLSVAYLGALAKNGQVEAKRVGRDWLLYRDSLDNFVKRERRKPGPKGPTGPKKKRNQPELQQEEKPIRKVSKEALHQVWQEATDENGPALDEL